MAIVSSFKLSTERIEALHEIAGHRGFDSISALLDDFIKTERATLGLSTLPGGWEIDLLDDGDDPAFIHISGNGLPVLHLWPNEARQLVAIMRAVLAGETTNGHLIGTVDGDQFVSVDRKGRGFRLHVSLTANPDQAVTRGMNRALLIDIADAIETVIGGAQ